MTKFNTKAEMIEAYAVEMAHKNCEVYGHGPERFAGHLATCRMVAAEKPKYWPHVYRGGWVIPGFGYSVERIGVNIPAERAGNPELVGA